MSEKEGWEAHCDGHCNWSSGFHYEQENAEEAGENHDHRFYLEKSEVKNEENEQ